MQSAYRDIIDALTLDPSNAFAQKSRDRLRTALTGSQPVTAPRPDTTLAGPSPTTGPSSFEKPSTTAPTSFEKRIALVIGNGIYSAPTVPRLSNPANDARAVAEALRRVWSTSVRSETNLKREALVNALKAFAAEAESADWAMVYYAGHASRSAAPIGWSRSTPCSKADRDVQYEAVALEQVIGSVEGAGKLGMVVLDACRDNPFARADAEHRGQPSIGRGLASVEPRRGTLVVFAAKHGQIALDGDGGNSPFCLGARSPHADAGDRDQQGVPPRAG